MAKFLKFDTCDRISPDANGLHQANHWFTVTVSLPRLGGRLPNIQSEYLVCDECMKATIRLSLDAAKRGEK